MVDPRATVPAREADLHLAVRGGTNLALLNALQHELFMGGHVDRDWVAAHALGIEELERTVADWPPERAAEVCGVPAAQIREAARILGAAERLLSTVLQGVYQSNQATAAACQVNNLHLLRGMLGRPGCGVLQMNGQPPPRTPASAAPTATSPASATGTTRATSTSWPGSGTSTP